MGRTNELTTEKRAQIAILSEQGLTLTSIAARFNVTHSCIIKTLKRYHETGDFKSKARTGRSKVTTQRADNRMHRYAKAYPFPSASEISSKVFPTGVAPSVVTIRRRLCKQFHLKSHVPAKKPCLSQKNIRDRIAFCQKYKDWSAEDWENVIFSDESLIEQFGGRSTSVRRPPCQRYNPKYLHCPKIMIWGAITANQSGGL